MKLRFSYKYEEMLRGMFVIKTKPTLLPSFFVRLLFRDTVLIWTTRNQLNTVWSYSIEKHQTDRKHTDVLFQYLLLSVNCTANELPLIYNYKLECATQSYMIPFTHFISLFDIQHINTNYLI